MAGRGRGRGKASMSFDVSRLGFGAGESLPKANVLPPPLFPPLQQRSTPLSSTEVDEYLLALSQEYRGSIRDSPFYLKPKTVKRDIVRYTDRYKHNQNKPDTSESWDPDWNIIPSELKPSKIRKSTKRTVKVNTSASRNAKASKITDDDVIKKLDDLENTSKDSNAAKKDTENADEEVVEELDDEEFEDENDYNFDYYNDGGDKYGDDDDGEEGPVY